MGEEDHQILEVDILFVGGGPANLAGSLRLTQLIANHNDQVSAGKNPSPRLAPRIALIEKGCDVVGFYLHPPDKALVLCGDEKAQTSAGLDAPLAAVASRASRAPDT